MNLSCYPESSIIRGGWMLDEACKYYWYLNKAAHVNAAGRAIAGFKDTTQKVFAPKLSYIGNKEDEDRALNFGNSLLLGAGIKELEQPSLIEFKKVMIASLLENFEKVLSYNGKDDVLVSAMYKQAELHNISLMKLKEMGEKIRRERAIRNGNRTKSLESFSDKCARELASSRQQIVELKEHIVQLEKKMGKQIKS